MAYGQIPGIDETTVEIDRTLVEIDKKIDWLYHLSPLDNHANWERFRESGYKEEPELRYPDIKLDLDDVRKAILALPVEKIPEPRIAVLLRAKQRELDLQLELLRYRGTSGFIAASIDLFGAVKANLCGEAVDILQNVQEEPPAEIEVNAEEMLQAAEVELRRYRRVAPDLWSSAKVVDDLNSMMMVNHGHLYIDRHTLLPRSRMDALVAHEVGVHVVTRYNGYCQPLHLLEAGTAHYDPLQEGLGVFAEYLAGDLPPSRLRTLAARVIAADRATDRETVCEIFERLHEEYGVNAHDAFDTAVRAKRGGGLTKDACYLRGLRDLLNALEEHDDFSFFFIGKFDLEHAELIRELLADGVLREAAVLPTFLQHEETQNRLNKAKGARAIDLIDKDHRP